MDKAPVIRYKTGVLLPLPSVHPLRPVPPPHASPAPGGPLPPAAQARRPSLGVVVVVVSLLIAAVSTTAVSAAAQGATDHPGQYDRTDVERGARTYATQCVACHGASGDMVARIDLKRGQFKSIVSDADLARFIAVGRPDAGMPAFPGLTPAEVNGLVAFIRSGLEGGGPRVAVGDASRGEAVFAGKGDCLSCHRVNGRGSYRASDLSDVGAVRSPASMHRALTDPAAFIIPANRTLRAVTRDGRTVTGRRLNEDTFTVQFIDEQARLVSLEKPSLRSLEVVTGTTMPAYGERLTPQELADLLGYLLSLKTQ